jgi:hypothetical protein
MMNIHAIECESMSDAIQHADASGFGEPILLEGRPLVVPQADCHRLEAAGVEFAYLHYHDLPDGSFRLVTVPVN